MTRGRPLRFLGFTLGGWTALRFVMLWPAPTAPVLGIAAVAQPIAVPAAIGQRRASAPIWRAVPTSPTISAPAIVNSQAASHFAEMSPAAPDGGQIAIASSVPKILQEAVPRASTEILLTPPPTLVNATAQSSSRFAGSTWLMIRRGTGDSLADGQLGASQAGIRLTYAIDRARGVALSGRLSAPLRGEGREAALGLDWQPTRLPVHLLIERRVDIDTGGSRTAGQVIAGAAFALPLGISLDSYAQAGGVARRGGFIDGAARLARPMATAGPARLEVGAGAWGGAQRGTARLDIGPMLAVAFPAQHGLARLSLEYRVRVAGRARPGSGLALTLGSSF